MQSLKNKPSTVAPSIFFDILIFVFMFFMFLYVMAMTRSEKFYSYTSYSFLFPNFIKLLIFVILLYMIFPTKKLFQINMYKNGMRFKYLCFYRTCLWKDIVEIYPVGGNMYNFQGIKILLKNNPFIFIPDIFSLRRNELCDVLDCYRGRKDRVTARKIDQKKHLREEVTVFVAVAIPMVFCAMILILALYLHSG